jgi:hypothetical protein
MTIQTTPLLSPTATVNAMMDWEDGEMDKDGAEEITLFQTLIDNGTVWGMPGGFSCRAQYLIRHGKCHATR